ncbi:HAD family hydrolase [Falsibacillus pallidus]|uniref:FMN phosphatase YigB (HAD superfamily) n=1 Tax=Falsibacillus pallidus TaxID=493781 RepID=A0A370FZJ2_9BACI|nr:HAD family hydrolase [Falsibacillus pallidus]RDI36898.1 FMN phosphatase YigB (HAD superfamily) [Falsibacillus pallidus]
MLNDVEVIVFDLDGTLYEDIHHFDYYASRLGEKLDPINRKRFEEDYQTFKENRLPLKIGTVYDVKNDLVLKQNGGKVLEAFDWFGEKLSEEKIAELYPQEIVFDFDSMLNVGDLWWIPVSIARHYGLSSELAHQSFLQTREYMMTNDFQMEEIEGFKDALQSLSQSKKLVLFTNSPQKDSEVIVTKLGFLDYFDYKIFEGRKPVKTEAALRKISDHYGVPFSKILSVGDNAINEIYPARKLGCQTILIDGHDYGDPSQADYVVKNISGVVELLEGLC